MLGWPEPWAAAFRELIAHERLVPYLNTIFGLGWRMTDNPFLNVQDGGSGGQGLHGWTSRFIDGTYFYHYANGQIRTGMAGFSFQLQVVTTTHGCWPL